MKWHFIVQGCTMDYRVDWTQGSCGFRLLAKFRWRSSLISTTMAKWQQLEECSLILCNKTRDAGGLGWDENEWFMNFFWSPQLHKLIRRVINVFLKHFWVRESLEAHTNSLCLEFERDIVVLIICFVPLLIKMTFFPKISKCSLEIQVLCYLAALEVHNFYII